MSKRTKGLSFEEKRKRMGEYLFEKAPCLKDFFQLKELEKHLPKAKGIVMQSVKEVLQSLVDDSLVNAEKIGTSNYFWSFPSQAVHARKVRLEQLEEELRKHEKIQSELAATIARETAGRQDSEERKGLLRELLAAEKEHLSYKGELEALKELDPDVFDAKSISVFACNLVYHQPYYVEAAAKEAKEAVDRWTDNIFTMQSYCVNEFGISKSDFESQFNIPEDFDYIQAV